MAKSYYEQPRRRVGPGVGRPNIIDDEELLALLPSTSEAVAGHFGCSRSAAYYRLRALEAEGTVRRDRGWGDRHHRWERR